MREFDAIPTVYEHILPVAKSVGMSPPTPEDSVFSDTVPSMAQFSASR